MKQEVERKFLVNGDSWSAIAGAGLPCRQGYISTGSSSTTVRVRLLGKKGFLTIKGPSKGISRSEMEYEIPADEAEYMIEHLCDGGSVSKTRYTLICAGSRWELDEFFGPNKGLVMAEIELESEDQLFEKPDWLGKEVSFDRRYTNAALARHPICNE